MASYSLELDIEFQKLADAADHKSPFCGLWLWAATLA